LAAIFMTKPYRVAVVINLNWTMKHHQEVFGGIQEYAHEMGWESETCPYAPEITDSKGAPRYDGIIARATPQLASAAAAASVPLVNVWLSSPATGVPTVGPDVGEAGRMAGEHLISRGFRRFGYVGFRRARSSRDLDKGFRDVVRRPGSKNYSRILNSTAFCDSRRGWEIFQKEIGAWIAGLETPVGIIAGTDKLARYVIDAARKQGLDIPRDLAVIGLENEEVVCMNPEPTITSIDLGWPGTGRRAGEILGELMDGAPAPVERVLLPPVNLVPRRSTDAYDVDDPDVAQALRFILENCHRPIKVSDVIEQAPLSWRSMERRFREARGGTISKEITRLRVERAKRLLTETSMLIKQVAEACGFTDTRRLCEVFARELGISPERYRQQRST
jgi:LacI family transcriptional regulator